MRKLLLLVSLIVSTNVYSDVYRCEHTDGNIYYTDEPRNKCYKRIVKNTVPTSEWLKTSGNIGDDLVAYSDILSIKKKGHKVKMWMRFDYNNVQNVYSNIGYLSEISLNEFDCVEQKSRRLDLYFYSGYMMTGKIVAAYPNIKEAMITRIPGSIGERGLKIACDKK
jgi:hypothetical protein